MSVLLEARDLHKAYRRPQGDVVVLNGCDFSLTAGESVAVIGPSGAGKSTLLNLLGTLDSPDRGELLHEGQPLDLARMRTLVHWRQRIVGFVFQFHFLLPDFTALENLLVPARMMGEPSADVRARADHLLDALDLSARADHLPGELSGGEQQRVAVARAFMNRPEIVLADEPFGNLDRTKSERLGELLMQLSQREGTALVIVTHDLRLAARADRILKLDDGRLQPAASEELRP